VDTHEDSRRQRLHPPGAPIEQLVVALECDRPRAGSARYSLEGIDQVTFGRGDTRAVTRRDHRAPTLDVRIPGRSMSAAHARLIRVGYTWAVEDLGSTNGIFVDGERFTRAVLQPDALLEVGHTFLRLCTQAVSDGAPTDADTCGTADPCATVDSALAADVQRLITLFAGGLPALLIGESGTGKEVLARHLHARTGRVGPFVAVNCGAIPSGLVESELFGHVKGAFSGAIRDHAGYVRAAHQGTLFLDEVADLPKASQASLLRVLQEREVVPVGTTEPVAVDVLVSAATHQPIDHLVERGEFREDLYARLAGCVLEIPPLRERRNDMGVLVAALTARLAPSAKDLRFDPDVGRALLSYDWPRNVRELERCLATCLVLAKDGPIDVSHLPRPVVAALRQSAEPIVARPSRSPWSEQDDRLRLELLEHLSRHQGNVTDVARAMGKPRTQIHRWCKRFHMNPDVFRN
jgi:sigma-54 dependent transcriptional regulator, acetoin dehydrogenase operon transcriptional activator AcoR